MQSASLVQHSRSASTLIAETEQQLVRLESLPPDWSLQFAYQLIEQARIIAPHQVDSVEIPWRRSLNANALPLDHLNGWHQGMERLQKLSDRLNRLDGQKGKYMTVSELKSEIFYTMHAFNQTVPAEEHLRRLLTMPAGKPLPTAAITQLEMHLKQLLARYALIKQPSMLNEKG